MLNKSKIYGSSGWMYVEGNSVDWYRYNGDGTFSRGDCHREHQRDRFPAETPVQFVGDLAAGTVYTVGQIIETAKTDE